MPLKPSDVRVDQTLTDFAIGYRPQSPRFVADEVFQTVRTANRSDKYWTFLPEYADDHSARAARNADGSYNRIQMNLSNDTYFCDDRGLDTEILDPVTADAANGLSLEEKHTLLVTEGLLLANEINAVAAIDATPPTSNTALTTGNSLQWSHPSSDVIGQVEEMHDGIEGRTFGARANRMLISSDVWAKLKVHPQILARISGGSTVDKSARVTEQLVADLFEVEKIVVARARKNTAKQGQTRSFGRVWSNRVLLYVYANQPDMQTEAYGIRFNWTGDTGGQKLVIEQYRDETKRASIIRARGYFDEKITGADFAAQKTNVVES